MNIIKKLLKPAILALLLFFGSGSGSVSAGPVRQFRKLEVINKCTYEIYPGFQTAPSHAKPIAGGGMKLASGASALFELNSLEMDSLRVFPRTGCALIFNEQLQKDILKCETCDCPLPHELYKAQGAGGPTDGTQCRGIGGTPPCSVAELAFGKQDGQNDFYDLSFCDGASKLSLDLKVSNFLPAWANIPPEFNCKNIHCPKFDFSKCPPELELRNSKGTVVACKSICTAATNAKDELLREKEVPGYKAIIHPHIRSILQQQVRGLPMLDAVCCACGIGHEGGCTDPESHFCCAPGSPENGGQCFVEDWPLSTTGERYDQIFKKQCPHAYSWQFDDHSSTYQCAMADFTVTFCAEQPAPPAPEPCIRE